jgi:hypothetical protein
VRNDEVPLCTTTGTPKTVASEWKRLSLPNFAWSDEADDVFEGLTGGCLAIGRFQSNARYASRLTGHSRGRPSVARRSMADIHNPPPPSSGVRHMSSLTCAHRGYSIGRLITRLPAPVCLCRRIDATALGRACWE